MDVINKDLLEQLKEFQEEGVVVEVFDFEDYMVNSAISFGIYSPRLKEKSIIDFSFFN